MGSLPRNATADLGRWRGLLAEPQYRHIRSALSRSPFRRLTDAPEVTVPVELLCQSVHVDRLSGRPQEMLAGQRTRHYRHSASSVAEELDEVLDAEIGTVLLQLYPADRPGPEQAIDFYTSVVERVRERYGALTIAVDTAGLCMGSDLRWGVRNPDGSIDAERTLEVLAAGVRAVVEAGADIVVTVGRVNFEASIARAALDSVRPDARLWAFSTNSETPNAYFDQTADDPRRALTGQKLLVGNGSEMVLRALRDVHEGVDVVVQKPVENVALLGELRAIADSETALADFLARAPVDELVRQNPHLFGEDVFADGASRKRLAALEVGTYEVSGTYAIFRHIEDTYGPRLAFAMLDELFVNALWAAGERARVLISRQAKWYARTRRELAG